MQGMSEYEFLITADTLTYEIRVLLYSTRGGGIVLYIYCISLFPINVGFSTTLWKRTCVTYGIWGKLKKAMLEVFDSVTLEDMVKMQKKKLSKQKDQMYYI